MPKSHRILHVDDDADIQLIVNISLQLDPEMSVVGVNSIREALAFLRDSEESSPDVLLLDYYAGDMTGAELLRQIKTDPSLPDIPAIFLTARVLRQEIEEMLAAGALSVISKPFNPVTLAHELRTLLGG